jgi:hypothetical protein
MRATTGRRRSQIHSVVGVAIYALFLLTVPFGHHDLLCHLKTPQHCTACTSSLVSADPHTPASAGALDLADAGGAISFHLLTDGFLLTVRSTGRSPPAVA